MVNRIVLNTISYHGKGAIEKIPEELQARGYKKAFVCTDPDLLKFGVTQKVTGLLDAAKIPYEIYSEIKPNPTIENVQHGVESFKRSGADCIVTIGGGSSMDTAKAIGIIVENRNSPTSARSRGVAPTKKHRGLYDRRPDDGGHRGGGHDQLRHHRRGEEAQVRLRRYERHPEIAVVDPDMMASMPKGLTAATGMDALTHAVEGYITKGACAISDMFHLEAIRLISENLRGAVQNTPEGREGMALGQYIAGMGFSNVGLGIVHSMAHGLPRCNDTPHGVACAIILPTGLEYNASVAGARYRAVGKAMGIEGIDAMGDEEAANATIAAVKQLSADVGIPPTSRASSREEDVQFSPRAPMRTRAAPATHATPPWRRSPRCTEACCKRYNP